MESEDTGTAFRELDPYWLEGHINPNLQMPFGRPDTAMYKVLWELRGGRDSAGKA